MEIRAPFIEIQMYFKEEDETRAFAKVLHSLVQSGKHLYEDAYTDSNGQLRSTQVFTTSIKDDADARYYDNLHQIVKDKKVKTAFFRDIIGTKPNSKEWLTYGVISKEALKKDHRPIAIVADGQMFLPTHMMSRDEIRIAYTAGRKVYKVFLWLVNELQPPYATISQEIVMGCPTDLAQKKNLPVFIDFFLNAKHFNERQFRVVDQTFTGAYFEQTPSGIYISSNASFNPKNIQWKRTFDEAVNASTQVSQIIIDSLY